MANYYAKTRTNYFRVKDEETFRDIVSRIVGSEEPFTVITKEKAGETLFGFYGDDVVGFRVKAEQIKAEESCCDSDNSCTAEEDSLYEEYEDMLYDELQGVVADGDAIIITEVGSEKHRYLVGEATIITNNEIGFVSLEAMALKKARELLNNPEWDTDNSY